MYSLNLSKRNVLITPDEVKAMLPSDHAYDVRKLISSITIAEERFIRPLIGSGLYDAMRASKNVTITTINKATYQALLNTDYDKSAAPHYILQDGDIVNAAELLSTDNKALWTEYLWLLITECVSLTAQPIQWLQQTNQGTMKNNPATSFVADANAGKSASAELSEVRFLMDKMLNDRISPMRDAVVNYICANKTKYPLFTGCKCDGDDGNLGRKTRWLTNLYDDDDDCRCTNPK